MHALACIHECGDVKWSVKTCQWKEYSISWAGILVLCMCSSLWMCQNFNTSWIYTKLVESSTSAASQSVLCSNCHACSAKVDALISPLRTALWSWIVYCLCSELLHPASKGTSSLVCPIYAFSQSLHGILYTMPFSKLAIRGTGFFSLTRMLWRVLAEESS